MNEARLRHSGGERGGAEGGRGEGKRRGEESSEIVVLRGEVRGER